MSFLSDSPFYEKTGVSKTSAISIRKVGQPNIIEIPVGVLEDWISSLDTLSGLMTMSTSTQLDLEDLAEQMRSYFKG